MNVLIVAFGALITIWVLVLLGLALLRSKGPLGGPVQGTARPENAVKIDDAVVAWS